MRILKSALLAGLMVAFLSAAASAQVPAKLSFHVGAGFAKMTNSGPFKDTTVSAPGGSIGFALGGTLLLPVGLGIGAEVGYDLLGSKSDIVLAPGVTGKQTLSLIPATAQGYYRLPTPGLVKPWITVGAGSYTQRVESEPIAGTKVTNNKSKFGWNVGAGIDFRPPAGGMAFGVDARYHTANNDSPMSSSHFITVMGRLYLDQILD